MNRSSGRHQDTCKLYIKGLYFNISYKTLEILNNNSQVYAKALSHAIPHLILTTTLRNCLDGAYHHFTDHLESRCPEMANSFHAVSHS